MAKKSGATKAKSRAKKTPRVSKKRQDIQLLTNEIQELKTLVAACNERIAQLVDSVETVLKGQSIDSGSGLLGLPQVAAGTSINWVIGPPENVGWAYGNNARRLAGRLKGYDHRISDSGFSDIAVYFDALVAERYPVPSKRSVLRIGGSRPLVRMFGSDHGKLRDFIGRFDAVVALNSELYLAAAAIHPNVHMIPNAVDLGAWRDAPRSK